MNYQKKLRLKLLELCYRTKTGHIGSALSCLDILISILFYKKRKDDIFILSKGHAAATLYCCLNELGVISNELLYTYDQDDTILPAHPAANQFPEIPFATGALGHGFPLGAGVAKGHQLMDRTATVFVLLSDGETNEGTTWETAHFAVKHRLNNLIVIIDKNKIQAFGRLEDVLGDTAQKEKWKTIGFEVEEIDDGHDIHKMNTAIEKFRQPSPVLKPKLMIANTVKGKGVSYMEDTIEWHYKQMNDHQYQQALKDVNARYHA